MSKKVIIIGSGGHAKVLADIIEKRGDVLLGFLDGNRALDESVLGYPVLGDETKDVEKYRTDGVEFLIGIGDNQKRQSISKALDVSWYTAIHPSAQIGRNVSIGEGTVIMANAVVNCDSSIGKHCIINTAASVDHDNCLGDYVHVSPHGALAGRVTVGKCCHIGIGASVIDKMTIGDNIIIGAGAVVVKDILDRGIYAGVPARRLDR